MKEELFKKHSIQKVKVSLSPVCSKIKIHFSGQIIWENSSGWQQLKGLDHFPQQITGANIQVHYYFNNKNKY